MVTKHLRRIHALWTSPPFILYLLRFESRTTDYKTRSVPKRLVMLQTARSSVPRGPASRPGLLRAGERARSVGQHRLKTASRRGGRWSTVHWADSFFGRATCMDALQRPPFASKVRSRVMMGRFNRLISWFGMSYWSYGFSTSRCAWWDIVMNLSYCPYWFRTGLGCTPDVLLVLLRRPVGPSADNVQRP